MRLSLVARVDIPIPNPVTLHCPAHETSPRAISHPAALGLGHLTGFGLSNRPWKCIAHETYPVPSPSQIRRPGLPDCSRCARAAACRPLLSAWWRPWIRYCSKTTQQANCINMHSFGIEAPQNQGVRIKGRGNGNEFEGRQAPLCFWGSIGMCEWRSFLVGKEA
jgi:hypothetical protein